MLFSKKGHFFCDTLYLQIPHVIKNVLDSQNTNRECQNKMELIKAFYNVTMKDMNVH